MKPDLFSAVMEFTLATLKFGIQERQKLGVSADEMERYLSPLLTSIDDCQHTLDEMKSIVNEALKPRIGQLSGISKN